MSSFVDSGERFFKAQAELRSVNGQIEYLLKQALQKRKGARSRPAAASVDSAGAPNQGQSGSAG